MKKTEAAAAAEDAPVAAKEAPKKKKNWLTVLKWTGIVLLAVILLGLVFRDYIVMGLVPKNKSNTQSSFDATPKKPPMTVPFHFRGLSLYAFYFFT